MSLPAKQRQALKAAAHHLRPVIIIGQKGVTESLSRETDAALTTHELIKVQVQQGEKDYRQQCAEALAAATNASLVQQIGKTFVLYRQKPAS
jgi:RNA-binding protein